MEYIGSARMLSIVAILQCYGTSDQTTHPEHSQPLPLHLRSTSAPIHPLALPLPTLPILPPPPIVVSQKKCGIEPVDEFIQSTPEHSQFDDEADDGSHSMFKSLLEMIQSVQSNNALFVEMKQFVAQRVKSTHCSLAVLMRRYPVFFENDGFGSLKIRFQHRRLRGHLRLSKIPNTVTQLVLGYNNLDSIGDLSDSKGSSLRYLDIKMNRKLQIDLSALENHNDLLPLQALTVSTNQISEYLKAQQMNGEQWIEISTLRHLNIWSNADAKLSHFFRECDGHQESQYYTSIPSLLDVDDEQDSYEGIGAPHSPQIDSTQTSVRTSHSPIEESRKAFESLVEMMRGVQGMDFRLVEAMQFIQQSIDSGYCSVRDLCTRYSLFFFCNDQRHLLKIDFSSCALHGILRLCAIPQTVEYLDLENNRLHSIGELTNLRGSSLRTLNLRNTPKLIIDLSVFQNKDDPLPLERLIYSRNKISTFFGFDQRDLYLMSHQIRRWMMRSTLKELKASGITCRNSFIYYEDGTVDRLKGSSKKQCMLFRAW